MAESGYVRAEDRDAILQAADFCSQKEIFTRLKQRLFAKIGVDTQ